MDLQSIIDAAQGWASNPQYQMYAAIAAGAVASGTASTLHELKHAKIIPLAFSERDQIEDEHRLAKKKIGPLSDFLTTANDLCMQVFQAYNESNAAGGKNAFVRQAVQRSTRTLNGMGLPELMDASKKSAINIKSELSDYFQVNQDLTQAIGALKQCWKEDHTDHYRTEWYMTVESYTDSKGVSHSRPVMKSREVYDHTTHEYWYIVEKGRLAAQSFNSMFNKNPLLAWKEEISPASRVSEEGKKAIRKSRGLKNDLPDQEYLAISRTWLDGTTRDEELSSVPAQYSDLQKLAVKWDMIKDTPKEYYCYNTNSHSDSGPKEYRVAKKNRAAAKTIHTSISQLEQNISLVLEKVPRMQQTLYQLQNKAMMNLEGYVTPDNKDSGKEAKVLKQEFMQDAKELYSTIFNKGIDLDRVKEWRITLFGLAGGLLGFGGWKLAEYLALVPSALE